jgi:hypothetical protein
MDRRTASTACLLAAPIIYEATRLIAPKGTEGSTAAQFNAAATHPGAAYAATILEAVSWWLVVPAAIGIATRLTGRGRTLGLIAASLAVLGSFAFSVGAAITSALIVMAKQPDRARMIAVYDKITSSGYLGFFVILLFAGLIGELLLAWAALRGGLVRWWIPALATAGAVIATIGGSTEGLTAALVYLPVAVAYVLFAVALLKQPRRVDINLRAAAADAVV